MTVAQFAIPASQAAATGAMMCAVSFAASVNDQFQHKPATALQIKLPKVSMPKVSMPKVSMPKLPDINIDLPNLGKKKPAPSAPKPVASAPPSGKVKVRASSAVVASNPDAPSASDLSGIPVIAGLKPANEWKRFPSRRMPGANMDGFKDMAKGMKVPPGM